MPKPATPFTWATDATFTAPGEDWHGEANKVAPAAGTRDEGYEPTAKVPADELNYLLNELGEWITWVDGLWGSDGTLTMDADADIVLSGAGSVRIATGGEYVHGDIVKMINGDSARLILATTGAVSYPSSGYEGAVEVSTTIANPGSLKWNVEMDVGQRVKSVTVRAKHTGAGTLTDAIPNLDIIKISNTGVSATLGSATGIDLTTSLADYTVNITDHEFVLGDTVFIAMTGGVLDNTYIQNIQVTYDRPGP